MSLPFPCLYLSGDLRNITLREGFVFARQPGEWSNRRKGIEVYGPNGERVTYQNFRRFAQDAPARVGSDGCSEEV